VINVVVDLPGLAKMLRGIRSTEPSPKLRLTPGKIIFISILLT
jgi:hypothetical protein